MLRPPCPRQQEFHGAKRPVSNCRIEQYGASSLKNQAEWRPISRWRTARRSSSLKGSGGTQKCHGYLHRFLDSGDGGSVGRIQSQQPLSFGHLLPSLEATLAKRRVVAARNRITGGGLTAGLYFGLRLAAVLSGGNVGRLMELGLRVRPGASI